MKQPSIRARTTALVLAVLSLVWLAGAGYTFYEAEHEAGEIFDGHLAQAASMLIAQTAIEIGEPEEVGLEAHAPVGHRYARKVAFQVWLHGRTLLVHSANAPDVRLAPVDQGFTDSLVEGQRWRVFSGWNARGDVLVQVGEQARARQDLADELAEGLLAPLMWALPVLGIVLWVLIGRAMRPLDALAAQIAGRSPDRLDPLQGVPVPREVAPLVDRLNVLLRRVGAALQAEKRFTGDAAHELRTPIAALAAQAEVALAATDDAERSRALRAVHAATRQMTRLVEQLLTLARADSLMPAHWPVLDLGEVARAAVGSAAPLAIARGLEVALEAEGPAPIRGEAAWLEIMLRNLLDNACRHSPRGSVVVVRVGASAAQCMLEVVDQGPGVPAEQLSRLGERFWRAEGQAAGTGLGLSIVRRVAELHAAQPEFSAGADGVGLAVRLRFARH